MDIKSVLEDRDLNQLVYNALSFGTAVMLGAFVYFLTQIKSEQFCKMHGTPAESQCGVLSQTKPRL